MKNVIHYKLNFTVQIILFYKVLQNIYFFLRFTIYKILLQLGYNQIIFI